MSDDGPPLFRPVPRRPFDLNLTSATPPEDDSTPPSPAPSDLQSFRFLAAAAGPPEGASLSRAQSIINLTSSTLFGIFSPTVEGKNRYYAPGDEPDTPWGTGAQTPVKRPSVDESTYELMKGRSSLLRRRQSTFANAPRTPPLTTTELISSLGGRAALLFLLGMGYGALVTRLRPESNLATALAADDTTRPGFDWLSMAFWGSAGVALGALLPWFDRVWENTFGVEGDGQVDGDDGRDEAADKRPSPSTDWALVVRGVGAFMGIAFAIRKLPWASTLQVSMGLALVNPFLWYLIDRSKPGFLLSIAVGLAGSAVLLGINPDMMPTPSRPVPRNESSGAASDPPVLGGFATKETIETGIWMISVLFCSCVCFGNVGRRLALNTSAAARGPLGRREVNG